MGAAAAAAAEGEGGSERVPMIAESSRPVASSRKGTVKKGGAKRINVPVAWQQQLHGRRGTRRKMGKDSAGKTELADSRDSQPLPLRTAQQLVLSIYLAKIKADAIDREEGTPVVSMSTFVVEYYNQEFGVRDVVAARLRSMILALNEYAMVVSATGFCEWMHAFAR